MVYRGFEHLSLGLTFCCAAKTNQHIAERGCAGGEKQAASRRYSRASVRSRAFASSMAKKRQDKIRWYWQTDRVSGAHSRVISTVSWAVDRFPTGVNEVLLGLTFGHEIFGIIRRTAEEH